MNVKWYRAAKEAEPSSGHKIIEAIVSSSDSVGSFIKRASEVQNLGAYYKTYGRSIVTHGPSSEKQREYLAACNPFIVRLEGGKLVHIEEDREPQGPNEARVEPVLSSLRRFRIRTGDGLHFDAKIPSLWKDKVQSADINVAQFMRETHKGDQHSPKTQLLADNPFAYLELVPEKEVSLYNGKRVFSPTGRKLTAYFTKVRPDTERLINFDAERLDSLSKAMGRGKPAMSREDTMRHLLKNVGKAMCDLHYRDGFYLTLHSKMTTYVHGQNFSVDTKTGEVFPVHDLSDVKVTKYDKSLPDSLSMAPEFPEHKVKVVSPGLFGRLVGTSMERNTDMREAPFQLKVGMFRTMRTLGIKHKDIRESIMSGYLERWKERRLDEVHERPRFLGKFEKRAAKAAII